MDYDCSREETRREDYREGGSWENREQALYNISAWSSNPWHTLKSHCIIPVYNKTKDLIDDLEYIIILRIFETNFPLQQIHLNDEILNFSK